MDGASSESKPVMKQMVTNIIATVIIGTALLAVGMMLVGGFFGILGGEAAGLACFLLGLALLGVVFTFLP